MLFILAKFPTFYDKSNLQTIPKTLTRKCYFV